MLTQRPSLIALSSIADAIAFQATAAKILEHYDAKQSAQHLHNAKLFHQQFGEVLAAIEAKAAQKEAA